MEIQSFNCKKKHFFFVDFPFHTLKRSENENWKFWNPHKKKTYVFIYIVEM